MKLLALETSSALLSLAGFEDGVLKRELSTESLMRQNENLAPLVQRLFAELGWKASQLNAVAVSLGPGSFTGLRTGLAFAKGLCYASGASLIGVPTLQAWAQGSGEVEVWLDARRGFIYRGAYKNGSSVKEPRMMPLEQARVELPAGFSVLGDVETPTGLPSAVRVGQLALQRIQLGEQDDPALLEPVYLRRAEAEILWEKRHQGTAGGAGLA